VLYLNHVIKFGENPLKVNTKYEYLTTSVTLHAINILEYPALFAR
jgi:hypothetical protein